MATLQPTMHPKPSALLCKYVLWCTHQPIQAYALLSTRSYPPSSSPRLEALEVALDSANNVHQHLHTEVSQLLLELDALRVQKAQYEQHIHDLAAQLNKEKVPGYLSLGCAHMWAHCCGRMCCTKHGRMYITPHVAHTGCKMYKNSSPPSAAQR